jgi:hypothetical protein
MTEEIVVEGPQGTQVMTMGGESPWKQKGRSSVPAGLLRDLFPPMLAAGGDGPMIIEEGRGPSDGGDPLMMDIMQAAAGERDPKNCREDLKNKCQGAKSRLHCLGINHDSISEACRKEVGKTVPFRCSEAIDRFCDTLQTGILACLYDHMADLSGQCRDSVLTTKHVIEKVNTQKVSLVDRSTGITKVTSPAVATPIDKEAKLDAKLGLKPVVAAAPKPAPLAAVPKAPMAQPTPLIQASPSKSMPIQGSWLPSSRIGTCLVIALVAFAAYLATFTDHLQKVHKQLTHRDGYEGMKLLNTNVELPKPDSL